MSHCFRRRTFADNQFPYSSVYEEAFFSSGTLFSPIRQVHSDLFMAKPIHLDGTTLEGGGQLFRLALSLSSLTSTPIKVTDIRGKRGTKPGQDGGIKPAHLAGAMWLAGATNAGTTGLELRSRNMVFSPSTAETISDVIWKEVYRSEQVAKGVINIAISTPGSVFLILQSILPFLIFAGSSIVSGSDELPSSLRLNIEGGTNVWHSLSYEYADQVLFPMLCKKLGLGPITMRLNRRGWSLGRPSIGKIELEITPLPAGEVLPTFEYTDRGKITSFRISLLGHDPQIRLGTRKMAFQKLERLFPDTEIEVLVDESSDHPSRLYLLIVAESENGFRLGRDWLYDQKVNKQRPMKTVELLVNKVINDLQQEISHGRCVDEWLQDQL